MELRRVLVCQKADSALQSVGLSEADCFPAFAEFALRDSVCAAFHCNFRACYVRSPRYIDFRFGNAGSVKERQKEKRASVGLVEPFSFMHTELDNEEFQ